MLVLAIDHVLNCALDVVEGSLDLLLSVVEPNLRLLNCLLLISLECQLIMTKPQLFETLLAWIASK